MKTTMKNGALPAGKATRPAVGPEAEPAGLSGLIAEMRNCEQAPGLSVLQHGLLVRDRYVELISWLRRRHLGLGCETVCGSCALPPDGRPKWRIPDWLRPDEAAELGFDIPALIADLPDDAVMARYHVFHDCGKPRVLTVDNDGRRHFPGHAAASREAWLDAGGEPEVADLIGMDMDVHLLKGCDVGDFARRPQAFALWLTGLAEIHANASMFAQNTGAIGADPLDSTSFKIKWKHLDKRGKAILKALHERTPVNAGSPLPS